MDPYEYHTLHSTEDNEQIPVISPSVFVSVITESLLTTVSGHNIGCIYPPDMVVSTTSVIVVVCGTNLTQGVMQFYIHRIQHGPV